MTSSSSPSQDAQSLAQNYPEGLRADALMEEDVAWSHEIDGERDGEQFDRSERAALRRVAGLSTELEDVTEDEDTDSSVWSASSSSWTTGTIQDADNSLAELAALAETAGALVLDGVVQRRDKPDAATYIGSGKANELRDIVLETGADTVICDGELSRPADPPRGRRQGQGHRPYGPDPRHLRPARQVPRGQGAGRARADAVHAAEAARLGLIAVRQMGGGKGGGLATVVGETKIETDRRRIREKMAKMRREIADMKTGREIKRQERRRNKVPSVAVAGYTNAGKSSLLNRLTGAGVLVENALFATLDPTVRRAETPSGRLYTLADTVGFVRHLPHHLVEAFRSTMEEVGGSDLILHVVDSSRRHQRSSWPPCARSSATSARRTCPRSW